MPETPKAIIHSQKSSLSRICIGSTSYRLNRFKNLALLERHAYKVFLSSKTGIDWDNFN
jgi:hypothetical protein